MGLSASFILVQNAAHDEKAVLLQKLRDYMTAAGYSETDASGADVTLRMHFPQKGQWFAIAEREDQPAARDRDRAFASGAFAAPVMSAELVDSDFAVLELFSADGSKAGSISVCEPYWGRDDAHADYDAFAAVSPDGHTADEIRAACEDDDLFAEDAFSELSLIMEFDPSVMWMQWDEIDPDAPEYAVLYYKKLQKEIKPQLQREECLYGIFIEKDDSLSDVRIMEQIDKAVEKSMPGEGWKRCDRATGDCVRMLETPAYRIIRSDIIAPANLAKSLGAALSSVSITDHIINTVIVGADGIPKGQMNAPAEKFDLEAFAASYGTTAEAFRDLNRDGKGCVNLYYEKAETPKKAAELPDAMRYLANLKVISGDYGDRFVYLFENPMQLSLVQIMEKLEAGLANAYGPQTFQFLRRNMETDEFEPYVYEYAGGICRTDAEHAEADLRVIVTDSGFALTGNLCLPGGKHFASVMEQNSMELYLSAKNQYAELHLIVPDGSTLKREMKDLTDYAGFCTENGFDPALLDAVYSDDAAVFYYKRP